MNSVGALLLAAGRSQRMGAFKPLLPFGGKSVVESCIDSLREGGIDNIVVVVGHRAEDVCEKLKDYPVSFAINADPSSDMNASVACGVRTLLDSTKAVVVALVDHPAVPASVIAELVKAWRGGARLVVPTSNGRGGHPVLIDLSFRQHLLELDSARGLRALFDNYQAEVKRVPVNSPYIARDIDTWDDYLALHKEVTGALPPEFLTF